MGFLVIGAGTIGLTYAFLLSEVYEVDVLVKAEQQEKLAQGVNITLKDLRKKSAESIAHVYFPRCVTEINKDYDAILIAVNSCQLNRVFPVLYENQRHAGFFVFMLNHWDIESQLSRYAIADKSIVAFPASVGGGRDEDGVHVILFDAATLLGGGSAVGAERFKKVLETVHIQSKEQKNIFPWLKLHFLQQSITAGAVLKSGCFAALSHDKEAVRNMVLAFREGIQVSQRQGVKTNRIFPAPLFKLPVFVLVSVMQKMFLDENTAEMICNHMKKGLPEWAMGYEEVLRDGLRLELPMSHWKTYAAPVRNYLERLGTYP